MTVIMRRVLLSVLAISFACALPARAQLGLFTREQRIDFTHGWTGERFPDGRPKVPDEVLANLKDVDAEEAWGVLQGAGYKFQFEGGWKVINPGPRMVGRVVTAVFMPVRPDVNAVIDQHGKQENRVGAQNSWIIDILQPGDILVVDLFGKVKDGTLIGDNLGTSIFSKCHNGLIVNGAVRDQTGLQGIKGFQVYTRAVDPSALRDVMLMGINVPIRIGETTIMPGDVAVTDVEGVTFIPPQLAQKVADKAQMTHRMDEWGHQMLREGKYTPGQIDGRWTNAMIEEFNRWLEKQGSKLRMQTH